MDFVYSVILENYQVLCSFLVQIAQKLPRSLNNLSKLETDCRKSVDESLETSVKYNI